ncbi:cytochrome c oxidase, cbb3-type, CcoQ subunit [Sulfurimonas aquatica]|uniref:Cytochrome c oxidase, cbb3-type, CcoQ subunit n=1 Tax=Sulfurimonas aquatica TaxID=2672570 RepID=A0A975B223_9BACT|nr:cytochrome c oxidase, cbb3-type, CcoQ subunit [Sulfurimonas aquatica]QSZ42806.1 cytochrome c oxidase, cbb3-type, CcoQ subunit [Sulfurimonas aquatica]
MDIAEFQAYAYLAVVVFMTVALYAYIYHLYKNRKDADGHDYEEYADLALHDDLGDTPVNAKSQEKEK